MAYFEKKPKLLSIFSLIEHVQCSRIKKVIGFKKKPKYTKIINLSFNSPDEILNSFRKNTRYDIRKAESYNINFSICEDINLFIKFYNKFAIQKNLNEIDENLFSRYYILGSNIFITYVKDGENIIVMHSYIIDQKINRVRLLHSASSNQYLEGNSKKNYLLGAANKYLHYMDILYFKNQGFIKYDFGGYAYLTTDKILQGINNFKDQFKGELIEESNFTPYFKIILIRIKHIIMYILNPNLYNKHEI